MKTKNIIVALIIGAIFVFLGIFISSRMQSEQTSTITPTTDTPKITQVETRSEGAGNIVVKSPNPNQVVGKNLLISGEARVFENVMQVRIKHNSSGETIFDQKATSDAKDAGQYGNFAVAVTLPDKTPKGVTIKSGDKMTVEAFQFSARDGSEIDKATIPVTY